MNRPSHKESSNSKSLDDLGNEDRHPTRQHPPAPPRLPLGTYGGALPTIDEAPSLRRSVCAPSSHRLSSSLTLPVSVQKAHAPLLSSALDGDTGLIVEFPHIEDENASASHIPEMEKEISRCDSRGRCIRHPCIRLRKKNLFRSEWEVLMKACPDCCIEEIRRIRLINHELEGIDEEDKFVLDPRIKMMESNGNDTASITQDSYLSWNDEGSNSIDPPSQDNERCIGQNVSPNQAVWGNTSGCFDSIPAPSKSTPEHSKGFFSVSTEPGEKRKDCIANAGVSPLHQREICQTQAGGRPDVRYALSRKFARTA